MGSFPKRRIGFPVFAYKHTKSVKCICLRVCDVFDVFRETIVGMELFAELPEMHIGDVKETEQGNNGTW